LKAGFSTSGIARLRKAGLRAAAILVGFFGNFAGFFCGLGGTVSPLI